MFKLIVKNLWQRRRQNAWLFAELIIVTVLTWIIVDPTVVGLYDLNAPLGYDADRIVRVSVATYPEEAEQYDSLVVTDEAYEALRAKADRLPEVEAVSYLSMGIDDNSSINNGLETGNEAVDTVVGAIYGYNIVPGEKFFTLYGIEPTEGSPSAETLDSGILGERDLIITESVDKAFWPDRRGLKDKRFIAYTKDGDTTWRNVIAIVKDFRFHAATRTGAVSMGQYNYPLEKEYIDLTLRLADGVDAEDYVRDYTDAITKELQIGNYYVSDIITQRQQISKIETTSGAASRRNLHFFVAALFLVNLIIGVVGCVWLQTGKRVQEIGVLRSYGARRRNIVRMLIGESAVLATAAFIIGDLIYLQYALKEGLSDGVENNAYYIPAETWITDFGEHFAIISAIVYAIILICAVIGTYFPARHVSRIEPVDALRDE